MPDNMEMVRAALARVAEIRDQLARADAMWREIEDSIIPADIREKLETAREGWEAETAPMREALAAAEREAKDLAEDLLLTSGPATVRAAGLMLVASFRVSWDGKMLQRIASEHPDVMRAQKVKPYISIRKETSK